LPVGQVARLFGSAQGLGQDVNHSKRLANFRFNTHFGLKPDIARGAKSALNGKAYFRGCFAAKK
jgi:hypothetical protein